VNPPISTVRAAGKRVPAKLIRGTGLAVLLLLLTVLTLPAQAGAQSNAELPTGTRIRVTPLTGQSLKGTFQGSGPEGLSLSDQAGSLRVLANASIQRLDMSAGKNRRKAALIGGAVGLVAGVLIGAATSGDCAGDCDDPYGVGGSSPVESVAVGTGALLGGVVFGGLGAGIGGLFFAPERWVRVELRPGRPVGR